MLKKIFRSLVALSLLSVPVCLVGCSDDDNEKTEEEQGVKTVQISDLVGTWEIVYSTYSYKNNGVVQESGSEDVSDEHNRFVFYPNGNFEFHEYSDYTNDWHEDGKGTLYMRNGKLECVGDFAEFAILSCTKNKLVAKYKFVEEEEGVIYEDEYTDTMERVE